MAKAAVDNYL